MITEKLTHVADGLDKLIQQYRNKPVIAAILTSYLTQVQLLEAVLFDVREIITDIDSQVGEQLDLLGRIYGQDRNGMTDATYLLWIKARQLVNRSSGLADEILQIMALVAPDNTRSLTEFQPASFVAQLHGAFAGDAAAVAAIVSEARAGGVGSQVIYAPAADALLFRFSSGLLEEESWAEQSNAKNFTLLSIAWSPALRLFVAVGFADGTDAYMLSSSDGDNWVERANPQNIDLQAVAWSPDLALFVAVGAGGATGPKTYAVTSTDGITWTDVTTPMPLNISLFSVAWSPSLALFVAVGAAGATGPKAHIVTSPDGQVWTFRTNPKNFDLNGVAWSPSLALFVAVGAADGVDSYLLTSADGTTWTERAPTVANNVDLFSVAWSPSLALFVAVGEAGYILTSPDGTTWTARTNPRAEDINSVAWSPALAIFIAGGAAFGSFRAYSIASTDGITWYERPNPKPFDMYGIAWSPELAKFAAVGAADGTDAYLLTSTELPTVGWGNVAQTTGGLMVGVE